MKLLTSLLSIFPFSWFGGHLFGQTSALNVPFSVDFPFKEGTISPLWKDLPSYPLQKLDEDGREALTGFRLRIVIKGYMFIFMAMSGK